MTEKTYQEAVGAGKNLTISRKQTREVLHMIKGMMVAKAIERLELVKEKKTAVPFKRYKIKVGHKPKIGTGRYPINVCNAIIKVLNNAKNNAVNIGLQEEKLYIDKAILMMDISKASQLRGKKGPFVHSIRAVSVKIHVKEKEEEAKQKKDVKKEAAAKKAIKEKVGEKKK